jgi:hypothetical protein
VLAVAALPAPADAAVPVKMTVWEITRLTSAPSRFAVNLTVGHDNNRTILAVTFLRNGAVLPGAYLASRESSTTVDAYAAGQHLGCDSVVFSCLSQAGYALGTVYYSDEGSADPAAPDRMIAVTYGRGGHVGIASDVPGQWEVRAVNRSVRAVWSSESDGAAGVWNDAAGAEVFTTATARGGRQGSVAIAAPPCSGAPGVAVTLGAGRATLTGGVAPVETSCPSDVLRPSQVAPGETTWTFEGVVAGTTAEIVSEPGTVRLLVVDF